MGFSIQWKRPGYLRKLHIYSIFREQCGQRDIGIG